MFPLFLRRLAILLGALCAGALPSRGEKVDFEKDILPILDAACFKCHSASAKKPKGDVRLDELEAIRAKSRSDNLIFPRKPEKSLLLHVIRLPEGDEAVMPPSDDRPPLAAEQVALIERWIEQGADFGAWKAMMPKQRPVAAEQEAINALDVAGTANRIDILIEKALAQKGGKPNAPLADDLWCRRVYLDLVGRIPTLEEMSAFLRSSAPDKRARLIEALLASNGHVSTMFNYWCDTLRARDQLADRVRGDFYLHFIKESIRTNKPYDQWVRELVSPEGPMDKAPAAGYYLRDLGNRFANVDHTAIVFLGTQIGCAQCHDHPYDQWTRRGYHQFAAWTSGIATQRENRERAMVSGGEMTSVEAKLEQVVSRRTTSQRRQLENRIAMQLFEGMQRQLAQRGGDRNGVFLVLNGTETRGRLPADYQYPDGEPNEPIPPAVLFGEAREEPNARPADTFAAWLTAPENSRFALTIANRMWTRIMGAPFSGTVDSVRDPEECSNPELAAYLSRLMVATRFDLRQFQRIVTRTRTYARQAGTLSSPGAAYDFPGPLLRRMSAEQVWDSLMALAVPGLDAKVSFAPPKADAPAGTEGMADSEKIYEAIRAQAKTQAKEQFFAARRHSRSKEDPFGPGPEFSELKRASELPQPAPESHFLRVFGQSNREIADGGWRSGTVPQTLLMLNSTLFDVLVGKGAPLGETLRRETGDSGRLRAAYLSILGRSPTLDEMRLISGALHGTGNAEAIAHTLLGTRQFLFIQ
jgi:hypothetical protein